MGAANKAFGDADYKAALTSFQGADAIMHLPTTGLGVMRSEEKLGLLVEARDKALEIGRIPQKPDEAQGDQDARKEAADLATSIEPRIASLTVQPNSVVAGRAITVSIDGDKLAGPPATLPRKVNPKRLHKIVVTAEGYDDGAVDATLEEGETKTVTVDMKAIPGWKPPSAPGPGPGAPPVEVHRGIHPLLWAGIATVGVGVIAGVAGGADALVQGKKCKGDGVKDSCPPAPAWISDVGFGVAGVGAILTIVAIPLSLQTMKSASTSFVIGPGFSGFEGRF